MVSTLAAFMSFEQVENHGEGMKEQEVWFICMGVDLLRAEGTRQDVKNEKQQFSKMNDIYGMLCFRGA